MALQSTIPDLKKMLNQISTDLNKAETGNKAAAQRVRTATVRLEKIAKTYRKESIVSEKQNKGRKTSKKTAKPSVTKGKKPTIAAAPKTTALKAKPKSALARPRALAFKKPSAKLPTKKR